MKNKLFLLLFLVVLFLIFVGVKFIVLDQQNAFGRLKIVSSPTTSVFVNNVAVSRTPFEEKYKIGEYLIKLIPESVATETASWNGKVKIYKNSLTYVNRELGSSDITSAGEVFNTVKSDNKLKPGYGEIYVETEPQGAIIYLDNDEKGVGPMILSDVLKGDHELSVVMPGFFRRTQKINIDPGYKVNAYFKLAIDQSQQKPTTAPKSISDKTATDSAKTEGDQVLIKDTPTGWLRVREDASIEASETAKVKPGEKYPLLEEKTGWYKIKLDDKEGWVSSEYSTKQ